MKAGKIIGIGLAVLLVIAAGLFLVEKGIDRAAEKRVAEARRIDEKKKADAKAQTDRYLAMSDDQLLKLFQSQGGTGLVEAQAAIAAGVCKGDCNRFLSTLVLEAFSDVRILIDLVNATDRITDMVYLRTLNGGKTDLNAIMLASGKYVAKDCVSVNETTVRSVDDFSAKLLVAMMVQKQGKECFSPLLLHSAVSRRLPETTEWLLKSGVEVDPDMFRSYMGGAETSRSLYEELVAHGADINFKVDGNTPLDRVLMTREEGVTMREVRIWQSYGATAKPFNLEWFQTPAQQ